MGTFAEWSAKYGGCDLRVFGDHQGYRWMIVIGKSYELRSEYVVDELWPHGTFATARGAKQSCTLLVKRYFKEPFPSPMREN